MKTFFLKTFHVNFNVHFYFKLLYHDQEQPNLLLSSFILGWNSQKSIPKNNVMLCFLPWKLQPNLEYFKHYKE